MKFLLYLICISNCNIFLAKSNQQTTSLNKELKVEKIFTITKFTIIPTIIFATIILNKDKLIQNIQNNPILSCLGSCLIINFIADSITKYKEIVRIIALFKLCKNIGRYMLYAIAIKNTMQQITKRFPECCFKEEEYFNTITSHIPLSFTELEQLTFEALHSSIKTMNALHIKAQTDIEANMYMLSKEHITLEDIIEFYNDDKELYKDLKDFLQNPIKYYDSITTKLNVLIKKNINKMIKLQHSLL